VALVGAAQLRLEAEQPLLAAAGGDDTVAVVHKAGGGTEGGRGGRLQAAHRLQIALPKPADAPVTSAVNGMSATVEILWIF